MTDLVAFLRARFDEDAREAAEHLCIHCGVPTAPLCSQLGITDYTHDGQNPIWQGGRCAGSITGAQPVLRPARVLAEVEAKRQSLEAFLSEGHAALRPGGSTEIYCGADYGTGDPCDCGRDERLRLHLRLLALPYADHPDYDEGWRP